MRGLLHRIMSGRELVGDSRRRLTLSQDPDLIYAVGDVHGCLDALKRLEAAIIDDAKGHLGTKLIVMLGDYIDRGPESAAVLEHLLQGPPDGFHRVCLIGNHDQAFLDVLEKPAQLPAWLNVGGDRTLASYGLNTDYLRDHLSMKPDEVIREIRAAVPLSHLAALERLPVCLMTPRYFFAHAGARPGLGWDAQTDRDLMWIRDEFLLAPAASFDRIVVHGHTISNRPAWIGQRICVDTGAFLGRPLAAARLEGTSVSFLFSAA
jgi:serine/threonine protein phosphatase 1